MCFNKELSLFATSLTYSAVIFSILNKYHHYKYFYFVMLYHIFTSGIIEPLEGVTHFVYQRQKSVDTFSIRFLESCIWYSLLLQPLIGSLLFIKFNLNPDKNKKIVIINSIFYIYTLYIYKSICIKIKPKNENGYTKLEWKNITNNNIWNKLEVFAFWSPLFFAFNKSIQIKICLIQQIIILLISRLLSLTRFHFTPSLWCFISSSGIWNQILITKMFKK